MALFSDGRRKLLARTFMDAFKIFLAAMLASEFFMKFLIPVRVMMIVVTVGALAAGFFIMPERGD